MLGDQFRLELVGVGQVGRVLLWATGVGALVGEEQRPAMCGCPCDEIIDVPSGTGMKGGMVQPRPLPVVVAGR